MDLKVCGKVPTHHRRGYGVDVEALRDIGWNPRWPIFHKRSGSLEEHEEHEGKHERITQTNKIDHTFSRSSKHKEIHNPNPTRDDTKGNRFFSVRRS